MATSIIVGLEFVENAGIVKAVLKYVVKYMATEYPTIGKLAEMTGVGVETVRYYQRRGLVREPVKPYGGVRRYTMQDVARIRFIKAAQDMGFTLAEIGELLALEEGGACRDVQRLAQDKLEDVRRRRLNLKKIEGVLEELVARCKRTRSWLACPIIRTLEDQAGLEHSRNRISSRSRQ